MTLSFCDYTEMALATHSFLEDQAFGNSRLRANERKAAVKALQKVSNQIQAIGLALKLTELINGPEDKDEILAEVIAGLEDDQPTQGHKLTVNRARQIRRLSSMGFENRTLAEVFSVTTGTIQNVLENNTWVDRG